MAKLLCYGKVIYIDERAAADHSPFENQGQCKCMNALQNKRLSSHGLGIACPYSTSMAILGEYFDKLKHIAFPVVGLGQAVSVLMFPPILQHVREMTGHEGALVFSACAISVNVVCGLLFKKREGPHLCEICRYCCDSRSFVRVRRSKAAEARSQEEGECERQEDPPSPATRPAEGRSVAITSEQPTTVGSSEAASAVVLMSAAVEDGETDPSPVVEAATTEQPKPMHGTGPLEGLRRMLCQWKVWLLLFNSLLVATFMSATESLWPLLATSKGISDDSAALGVALAGVGYLVACVVALGTGNRSYDRLLCYMLTSAICGVCVLLAPEVPLTTAVYMVLFTLFGWWIGLAASLVLSVISDIAGPDDFSGLIGLYSFMSGLGYFIGPIGIGTMEENYGEIISWTVCGCVAIASALLLAPEYARRRLRSKNARLPQLPLDAC